MVEIKTERASYYISTHGKCEYIDIEPGIDTFTFLSPKSLKDIVHQAKSQSYLWQNVSICNHLTHGLIYRLKDINQTFPDVRTLIIEDDVGAIHIDNRMFPNVRHIISNNKLYANDVPMLITQKNEPGYVRNVFCIKQEETVDLCNAEYICNGAFSECCVSKVINSDSIWGCEENAFKDCKFLFDDEEYTDGIVKFGKVIVSIKPGLAKLNIPDDIDIYPTCEFPDSIKEVSFDSFGCLAKFKWYLEKYDIDTISINDKHVFETPNMSQYFGNLKTKNINITEENQFLKSIDGAIFTVDEKILLYCPQNKDSYTIPDKTETIGSYAFSGCHITSITIPDTISSIGSYAFSGCEMLTEVKLGNGITDYGEFGAFGIFQNCTGLKHIEIPPCVTATCENMFHNVSLESVVLHEGLRYIGRNSFRNVTADTITLPASLKLIAPDNFHGVKVFNICGDVPAGLIVDIAKSTQSYSQRIKAIKVNNEDVIFTLNMMQNGQQKKLYFTRYISTWQANQLDYLLSTFKTLPDDYLIDLCKNINDPELLIRSVLMLYKHTHENKLRKLLQIMSGSILRRCIDWENDELTIELLSIQIFAQQELNELLKFAQKQDNTTLTAAVLNVLADCNDTSDFII